MKIYQINVVCGNGSTGRIATDLADVVKKNGGSSRIAYGRGNAPSGIDAYKIGNGINVYFHAMMTRLTDRHGRYSKKATEMLIKDIEEYNPDVIHLHNIHGYYLHYEVLFHYLSECGKPVVWTMHDCWAFTGHCSHYESVGCEKWKSCCEAPCPNIKGYPASKTSRNVRNNYRSKYVAFLSTSNLTIVAPSIWLAKQLKESFLNVVRTGIIPNGIDLGKFSPKENSVKEAIGCVGKKLVLGVASVWGEKKGLEDFIRLSAILGDGYQVCLVGLSDRQIRALPKKVKGIKRTDGIEELAQFYTAADVFLNLTYEDTFPTTNIEALACGTPVVTYHTGGSTESVVEGCGQTVPVGDVLAVANILHQMESANWYSAEACIARAQEYEKEKQYKRYIELYRDIIQNGCEK